MSNDLRLFTIHVIAGFIVGSNLRAIYDIVRLVTDGSFTTVFKAKLADTVSMRIFMIADTTKAIIRAELIDKKGRTVGILWFKSDRELRGIMLDGFEMFNMWGTAIKENVVYVSDKKNPRHMRHTIESMTEISEQVIEGQNIWEMVNKIDRSTNHRLKDEEATTGTGN